MLYSELRDKAETGDVLMIEGKGLISIIIRMFTAEKISHVGVLCWLDDRKTCLFVVEMRELKSPPWRNTRASDWIKDVIEDGGNVYFGKAPESVTDLKAVYQYLFDRRKLKYDYIGLLKIWWSQLRRKGFRKAIEERTSEVCSTFAAGAWAAGGWIKPDKDFDPGDFFEHAETVSIVKLDPVIESAVLETEDILSADNDE